MKKIIFLFISIILISCQKNIYPINPTITKENLSLKGEKCPELIEFINKNVFFVKETNSYVVSHMFSHMITKYYYDCVVNLSFEEIPTLFGEPSCQTETQLCYYFHFHLPKNVTFEDVKLREEGFVMVFTKKDNKTQLGGFCNCKK
ncbi:MAG: hypothetical protein AB8G11_22440 [Saprospiraceae bacterium]